MVIFTIFIYLFSIIPGTMTVEAVYQDRDTFADMVRQVASPDLGRMGMEILSFTIKVGCIVKHEPYFSVFLSIKYYYRPMIVQDVAFLGWTDSLVKRQKTVNNNNNNNNVDVN